MSPAAGQSGVVRRDDIEAKLREIRGEVETGVERAKVPAAVVAAGAVAVVIVGAYLLGRRRGRKRTTIVEVRRV